MSTDDIVREYIITCSKALRDLNGEHPTPEQIQQELADRCIQLVDAVKERDHEVTHLRRRILMYEGVSRP